VAGADEIRLTVYTDSAERAGAEIVLGHLLAALSPRITVTHVGVDPGVVSWLVAQRPGSTGTVVRPVRGKTDLLRMLEHRHAIARARPDLVHANLTSLWSCRWGLLAAWSLRIPVVAVEHLPMARSDRIGVLFKRFLSRRTTAHIAVGSSVAREVEALAGLAPGSVRSIANGIPDEVGQPFPRLSEGPVLGTLARLHQTKGIDVLLRALVELPDVTAVVVGSGPEDAALRALARALGVEQRIRFVGWSERSRDYLQGFDVFVLPSRVEGQPLTIIEAMLAELPVVATAVGGVPELVAEGATGLLVPPDDSEALATAVATLLADPARRAAMGSEGRRRALKSHTDSAMARNFEQIYTQAVPYRKSSKPTRR
jgi:glycosyltransferase involved in cell wall biosynthesis